MATIGVQLDLERRSTESRISRQRCEHRTKYRELPIASNIWRTESWEDRNESY